MSDDRYVTDLTVTLLRLERARSAVSEASRGEWGDTNVFNLTDQIVADLTRGIEALEAARERAYAAQEGATR